MSFFAGGWYRCPAAASQLHVATAYWLAINGSDRQTDGRTDTVSLHIRLPIKAYSVDNNISCEENTRAKCPIVRRTSIIKRARPNIRRHCYYLTRFLSIQRRWLRVFLCPIHTAHPPDTTRQCWLCRVRRCEMSLETVWQSLNSAWRLVKFFLGLVICNSPQRVYIFVAACGRSGG